MTPKRNRRYLNAAAGQPCVLCGSVGTTVSAHLPHAAYAPAGKGTKCDDFITAHCCYECHQKFDQGEWRHDHFMRMKALALTLLRNRDEGILRW